MQSLKTESSFTFLTIAKGAINGIARELKLLLQQFMEPDQHPITSLPKLVEEWRPIPGYEGLYSVSSLGNVRSEERQTAHGALFRTVKERVLCQNRTTNGYLALRLWRNAKFRVARVHQLVAGVFVDKPQDGLMVDHIDRDRCNNKAENLRWVTKAQNMKNTQCRGSSGFKFAYLMPSGKYQARYKPRTGKRMANCGTHDTPYQAHVAALAHRLEHHWNP
jgi:hypothetical protein